MSDRRVRSINGKQALGASIYRSHQALCRAPERQAASPTQATPVQDGLMFKRNINLQD